MSIDRAIELQEQAWSLQAKGELDAAFTACRTALLLLEESEGSESPDVANLLNDLSEIECDRQNFSTARSLAERAQVIENALGDRFAGDTATRIRAKTYGLLGSIHRVQGDYAAAELNLEKAHSALASEFGDASAEVADARNNLAVLYKYCGRFEDGLRLYRKALQSVIAIHGEESLACSAVYHNLGGILHARGDFTAAEEPARRAWEISQHLLGADNPQAMLDLAAYAGVLDGLQRHTASESIYRRALAIFETAFPPEHYEIAATLQNLGSALAAQGRRKEAEQHYRRALAIQAKVVGDTSVEAALTRNNLGKLLTDDGRFDEAVPLLEIAVRDLDMRLPPAHPHLARVRANLDAAISSNQVKRTAAATALQRRRLPPGR